MITVHQYHYIKKKINNNSIKFITVNVATRNTKIVVINYLLL